MAPTLKDSVWKPISVTPPNIDTGSLGSAAGPLSEAIDLRARVSLARRDDDDRPNPSSGVLDPHDISNVGFFVLFALIGLGFVITGIWFFFWAKNGGFHFRENDWEDYKSTVLRRKGPNGTLLSGATPSTNLGGGSIYHDVAEHDDDDHGDGTTVITETTAMSGITAGPSEPDLRMKRERKKEREREKRRQEKRRNEAGRHVGNDGVEDDYAERAAKKELRSYRHEKAARVGGINKESDGSQWDGSTNPTESTTSSDVLLPNKQRTPTSTPTKKTGGGIRKVYSTADRIEAERLRKDARRRREEEQAGSLAKTTRRDFSFQKGTAESAATESLLESGSDLGTKSYHHPRPELRAQRQREREERRERRGGYRRGRGDDEDL